MSLAQSSNQADAADDMGEYDDDYATCGETYATLRFYHPGASPDEVTQALGLEPSKTQKAGDLLKIASKPAVKHRIKSSGWFLNSDGHVSSKDVRRHIDWLLDALQPSNEGIIALYRAGWKADVFCYWVGYGHGGPMLDPRQMKRLVALDLTCGFDVYCYDEAETSDTAR